MLTGAALVWVAAAAAAPARAAGQAAPDSVVYRISPASRLDVLTGKSGLFGFAGHSHRIRARAFSGAIVRVPSDLTQSRVEVVVVADSLEALTPPDTAELRKVTETMHSEVLHTERYPEIRLVSRSVAPAGDGLRLVAALTLAGETREVPVDVTVEAGADTLHARCQFSVKQSDFGIKPYSGGPAGTVKVADRVKFDIDIVGVREASP
jgi:polyisoprenoid-binding protein YceI